MWATACLTSASEAITHPSPSTARGVAYHLAGIIASVSSENESILESLRRFVAERDWKQFHTPKNLTMALSVEASELMEHFQWLTAEESDELTSERKAAVAEEIADVQIYLMMLADRLGIDVEQAVRSKIVKNGLKYPAGTETPEL